MDNIQSRLRFIKTMTTIASSAKKQDETLQTLESSSSSTDIFTTMGPDFTITHILPRLDGPTLIAFACTSPQLRRFCMEVELFWQNVCTLTWPSLLDPIVTDVISTFPGGYRSFFYNAFRSTHHTAFPSSNPSPPRKELISAVDLYCKQGLPCFSKAERLLNTSPPRDNYINMYEFYAVKVNTSIVVFIDDSVVEGKCEKWLKENMRLSLIVIDPSLKRAANLISSGKPLLVQVEPSLYGFFDFIVVFGVMMAGGEVMCEVKVRCSFNLGKEKSVLCIRRVSMEMEVFDTNLWWIGGMRFAELKL